MILSLALALGAQAASCPDALRVASALEQAVEASDLAISALDIGGLERAVVLLQQAVPCQAQPISPTVAADIHRVEGVYAFVNGREQDATSWFAAAQALAPGMPLGPIQGGPILSAWDRARPASPPLRTPLPPPLTGALWVDGIYAEDAPALLPFLLQQREGDQVLLTALRMPGQPFPAYPSAAPLPGQATGPRPLTRAAVGAAALSLTSLAGAAVTRAVFNAESTDWPDVKGLVGLNHALGVGGAGLGAAALGLGVAARVQGEW
ncbi:MAG: hypothetical protein JXX28_03315 [Deltaproteobacteria bacterium]|nr:hypothetical protein [Deltaproteobacteria bacterium]